MQFKAKNAPGKAPPKFLALKSTKSLTVPQEFNLKTEQRENSKKREQTFECTQLLNSSNNF